MTTTERDVADDVGTEAPSRPRISYLAKQVESAVRRGLDDRLAGLGLTTPQYAALSLVRRNPDQSSAQLARRSFITPQSAQTMVQNLERRGLIERAPHPENQRILRIRLSEHGAGVLADAEVSVDAMEARMLDGIDPATEDVLRSALSRCARNLRETLGRS